jgi:hypothetical protein
VHISIGVKKLYMLIEMARQVSCLLQSPVAPIVLPRLSGGLTRDVLQMEENQAETFLDNLYEECKSSL